MSSFPDSSSVIDSLLRIGRWIIQSLRKGKYFTILSTRKLHRILGRWVFKSVPVELFVFCTMRSIIEDFPRLECPSMNDSKIHVSTLKINKRWFSHSSRRVQRSLSHIWGRGSIEVTLITQKTLKDALHNAEKICQILRIEESLNSGNLSGNPDPNIGQVPK